MADDVSGNYSLPPSYFVQDGDTVLPEQHNPPFEDVASALSNRIHKDGRTLWTGDQNANNHKITGLANGVALTDAANVGQAVAASTPIGSVVFTMRTTAPANWFFCYGQAISRTTYNELWVAMGSPNTGDGSTTFNLPDGRDYVPVGKGNMGGTAANRITVAATGLNTSTLGAAGGSQTHTLTTAQIPVHTHTASTSSGGAHTHTAGCADSGNHAHTLTTNSTGTHTHTYTAPQATIFFAGGSGQNVPSIDVGATTGSAGAHAHTGGTDTTGLHNHVITVNSGGAHTHPVTVDNAGSGAAHPILQPSLVMNMMIRVA